MIEIDGKKVRTLPEQVLENQKNIEALQAKEYIHVITIYKEGSNFCNLSFMLRNGSKDLFDTISKLKAYMAANYDGVEMAAWGITDFGANPRSIQSVKYDADSGNFIINGYNIDGSDSGETDFTFATFSIKDYLL